MSQEQTNESDILRSELATLLADVSTEGHADLFAGKRERFRFWTSRRFDVRVPAGTDQDFLAVTLRNISGSGLALWSHRPLAVKTRIEVRAYGAAEDTPWLDAIVTHATRGVGGHLIGAAFVNPLALTERPESRPVRVKLGALPTQPPPPATRRSGLLSRLFSHF
jgi:hypothetical protein